VTAVDAVGLEERAAMLATRSIKKETKAQALDLLIRICDLTTLEGSDTPGKVRALCAKARRPDLFDATVPPVAAVCVYPLMVPVAVEELRGTGRAADGATARAPASRAPMGASEASGGAAPGRHRVKVASVAGAFPSGLGPLESRLEEVAWAVEHGADEIDMVLDRSAFLSGDTRRAFDEIVATKKACGSAHLKVILETGELGTYDAIRRASVLAMEAGADFIKTSTGKIGVNATLPTALCMLEAIRDFHHETGRMIGFKAAGGVKTAKQGWQYLVVAQETVGPEWLDPSLLRIGASSMLNDVLHQLHFLKSGRYDRPEHASVD
jgi:deoxyribose-phosphate aldolase